MKLGLKVVAAVILSALLTQSQLQAGRAHRHASGLKGKIVSVAADGSTITISQGKKKGGSQTTIQVAATPSVTIDVIGGKKVTDLQPGEMVLVNPTTGTATTIIARQPHHKTGTAT